MAPSLERKVNELYAFMQALKSSTTIPQPVDAAFRRRLIADLNLTSFGIPNKIKDAPRSAITGPIGGSTVDSEARGAINSIITVLEELGLVEEN